MSLLVFICVCLNVSYNERSNHSSSLSLVEEHSDEISICVLDTRGPVDCVQALGHWYKTGSYYSSAWCVLCIENPSINFHQTKTHLAFMVSISLGMGTTWFLLEVRYLSSTLIMGSIQILQNKIITGPFAKTFATGFVCCSDAPWWTLSRVQLRLSPIDCTLSLSISIWLFFNTTGVVVL